MDKYFRSFNTSLSDKQLGLLDVLAICGWEVNVLKSEEFSERANMSHHGYSNKELDDELEKMVKGGLLEINDFYNNKTKKLLFKKNVNLTNKGGGLWEAEREPVWSKYAESYDCFSSDVPDFVGNNKDLDFVLLESQSLTTVKKMFEYYVANKLNGEIIGEPIYNIKRNVKFLYWKNEVTLHKYYYQIKLKSEVDWNKYETNRTWWRTVRELQKFVGQ